MNPLPEELIAIAKEQEDQAYSNLLQAWGIDAKIIEALYAYFTIRKGREDIESINSVVAVTEMLQNGSSKEEAAKFLAENWTEKRGL